MLALYVRLIVVPSVIQALLFVSFLNNADYQWISGLCFGSLLLTLNAFLSVFLFTQTNLLSKKGILHRLALLLAISIKGVNLLFLAYLGIERLNLGAYPIVLGAMCALVIHVVVFFLFSKLFSENAKRTLTES